MNNNRFMYAEIVFSLYPAGHEGGHIVNWRLLEQLGWWSKGDFSNDTVFARHGNFDHVK